MYKIFINEHQLILQNKESGRPTLPHAISLFYRGKRKLLINCIDKLEKAKEDSLIYVLSDDVDKLWEDFQKLYKLIDAAGGLVLNPQKKGLFIYRMGYWDLPKGKKEKTESIKEAAIREVEEETGLSQVKIEKPLIKTYHTYQNAKGHRILKTTYWYQMKIDQTQQLQLQAEEGIEEALWIKPQDFLSGNYKTYQSILTVLEEALS